MKSQLYNFMIIDWVSQTQNKNYLRNVIKRELEIDIKVECKDIHESRMCGKAHKLKFGSRVKANATKPRKLFSAAVSGSFKELFSKCHTVCCNDHNS
jgi:hypothetical protein